MSERKHALSGRQHTLGGRKDALSGRLWHAGEKKRRSDSERISRGPEMTPTGCCR